MNTRTKRKMRRGQSPGARTDRTWPAGMTTSCRASITQDSERIATSTPSRTLPQSLASSWSSRMKIVAPGSCLSAQQIWGPPHACGSPPLRVRGSDGLMPPEASAASTRDVWPTRPDGVPSGRTDSPIGSVSLGADSPLLGGCDGTREGASTGAPAANSTQHRRMSDSVVEPPGSSEAPAVEGPRALRPCRRNNDKQH